MHELGGEGDPARGYFAGLHGKLYAKVTHDINGKFPVFELRARARLIYRRAFRALVDDKGWTEDGHGKPHGDHVVG